MILTESPDSRSLSAAVMPAMPAPITVTSGAAAIGWRLVLDWRPDRGAWTSTHEDGAPQRRERAMVETAKASPIGSLGEMCLSAAAVYPAAVRAQAHLSETPDGA